MNNNENFESFAYLLANGVEPDEFGNVDESDDLWMVDRLDRSKLDGSLISLKTLDAYLYFINQNLEVWPSEYQVRTILRSGAYLGEVLRKIAPTNYNWYDRDSGIKRRPDIEDMLPSEPTLEIAGILMDEDGILFPIAKALRTIQSGLENTTFELGANFYGGVNDVLEETIEEMIESHNADLKTLKG